MNWEYKILNIDAERMSDGELPEDLNVQFNELGKEGWELVKLKPVLTSGFFFLFFGWATSTDSFVAVFKREGGGN